MLRTGLAAILLVLLIPMVVAANTSFWALRTVLNSGTFSTTVGRALDTPAVERLMAASLADIIIERMDRAPAVVAAGLASRQRIARRIGSAAGQGGAHRPGSESPSADQAVRQVRDEVVNGVHGEVIGLAEGQSGLVSVRGNNAVLDTAGLLKRVFRPQLTRASRRWSRTSQPSWPPRSSSPGSAHSVPSRSPSGSCGRCSSSCRSSRSRPR